MAVKHSYYTDKTPEEMKEAWQKSTRKRYYNPSKIEAREGRDRALGWNRTENWRQYDGNNVYYDKEWTEENGLGINPNRKKNTRELIEDAFRKTKKSK